MPEIAEVESIAVLLHAQYSGNVLSKIETYPSAHLRGLPRLLDTTKFDSIMGRKVVSCTRLGKHIVVSMDNGLNLVTHLMMSGLFLMERYAAMRKHLYVKMMFVEQSDLLFFDPRRFAKMFVCEDAGLQGLTKGLDAMDSSLDADVLLAMLTTVGGDIKSFLLERQDKIVGIGNIYACEILWEAKISPFRQCADIVRYEAEMLFSATKLVLNRAVACSGSTLGDGGYLLPDGSQGMAQNFHMVYGKKTCFCGSEVHRVIHRGRSTFYCQICQL